MAESNYEIATKKVTARNAILNFLRDSGMDINGLSFPDETAIHEELSEHSALRQLQGLKPQTLDIPFNDEYSEKAEKVRQILVENGVGCNISGTTPSGKPYADGKKRILIEVNAKNSEAIENLSKDDFPISKEKTVVKELSKDELVALEDHAAKKIGEILHANGLKGSLEIPSHDEIDARVYSDHIKANRKAARLNPTTLDFAIIDRGKAEQIPSMLHEYGIRATVAQGRGMDNKTRVIVEMTDANLQGLRNLPDIIIGEPEIEGSHATSNVVRFLSRQPIQK